MKQGACVVHVLSVEFYHSSGK